MIVVFPVYKNCFLFITYTMYYNIRIIQSDPIIILTQRTGSFTKPARANENLNLNHDRSGQIKSSIYS